MPCSHKKKACQTCSSCPLCPGCACNGPRRERGRPPKAITPAKRRSSVQATKEIGKHCRLENQNADPFTPNTLESTPSALINLLGIPRQVLPSIPKRESLLLDLRRSDKMQLYSTLDRCLIAICHLLLPKSAVELYRSFKETQTSEERLVGALVDGLNASKKGSVERKTLRALFCSSFQGSDVQRLLRDSTVLFAKEDSEMHWRDKNGREDRGTDSIQDLPTNLHTAVANNVVTGTEDCVTPNVDVASNKSKFECRVDRCLMAAQGHVGTAQAHKCTACAVPVHILCCQRLLGIPVHDAGDPLFCSQCFERQALVSSKAISLNSIQVSTTPPTGIDASPNQQEQSVAINEDEGRAADSSKKPSRSGMFARTFQRARKDWEYILSHGCVTPSVNAKRRRSDESIRKALKFLFQSDIIQMLSWGTKRIKVEDKWLQFPAVLRRKTAEKIYREYVSFIAHVITNMSDDGNAQEKPLARSVFLQTVASLTRGQQSRKAAVDYVLGTLAYDSVRLSREIVSLEIEDSEQRRRFLSQLDSAEEFLKFTFLKHIGIDSDSFHDPGYALEENVSPYGSNKQSKCGACMAPFQVINNIKDAVNSERKDVIDALSEIEHKFVLYVGHQHRCFNQEKRIAEIFSELKRDVLCSKTVLLLDYKMKFEPIRYREKTTEFYGKKGISWHGAAIFHNSKGLVLESDSSPIDIETVFLDHILSNDMKQEVIAVASILDAILARMTKELPNVNSFYILSDNARCYQNDFLPVIAPFMARSHGLCLSGIVHSETQRGKSLLGAHFAIAMMHINRYCQETRKDVTTPGDIVEALNSFEGIANCTAEMVHISRSFHTLTAWKTQKAAGNL